jgi:hypothetical protein
MFVTTEALIQTRELLEELLEELALDAYLFEVEPRDGAWEVRIECAVDGGWQSHAFMLEGERLTAAAHDADARLRLLRECDDRLAGCGRKPRGPG